MVKLTANQILHLSEIKRDEGAVMRTLELAMTHAENRLNELGKRREAWWQEMAEIHDLDLHETNYKTQIVEGCVQIIEKETDD